MRESELREVLVDAARAMNRAGLNRGTAGNLSARVPDGMLITPSAVPYEAMAPGDLLRLDLDGAVLDGAGTPSTEWRLHAAILRERPEVGAVLHAHPPFATTIACLRRDIPAVHYMVAAAGGTDIRCAPYATFGTAALADHAVDALRHRTACLLAHHGLLALGPTPPAALQLAVDIEAVAEVFWRALLVEEPDTLSDREMADVLERFSDYRTRD